MPAIKRETKNIPKFNPLDFNNEPVITDRMYHEPTAPVLPLEYYEEYFYGN